MGVHREKKNHILAVPTFHQWIRWIFFLPMKSPQGRTKKGTKKKIIENRNNFRLHRWLLISVRITAGNKAIVGWKKAAQREREKENTTTTIFFFRNPKWKRPAVSRSGWHRRRLGDALVRKEKKNYEVNKQEVTKKKKGKKIKENKIIERNWKREK